MHCHLFAFAEFSQADHDLLAQALSKNVRKLGPRQDIICEGDNPKTVNVLLSGWAMRYKHLPDGRRQILSFCVPGDLCDANVYVLKEMDHSIGTLTDVTFAEIAPVDFEKLAESSARISKALWWSELVTMAVQREWTTSIGQRSAYERLAHLFCEMRVRLSAVGIDEGDGFLFPVTQNDLADATGMTPVHANRTLQRMRGEGLIELSHRHLKIRDPERLTKLAQFNPNYLHLAGGNENLLD